MLKYLKNLGKKIMKTWDSPILIQKKGNMYMWYDPSNDWGGVTVSLENLKKDLKKRYKCECNDYHVSEVWLVEEKGKIKKIRFEEFIHQDCSKIFNKKTEGKTLSK